MVKQRHTEPKIWCLRKTLKVYIDVSTLYLVKGCIYFTLVQLSPSTLFALYLFLFEVEKKIWMKNNIVLVHGSQRWHSVNNPIVLHNYCYNSLLVMMWNLTRWTLIPIWYPEQRSGVTKSGKSPDFLFKLMRGWEWYILNYLC